MKNIQELENKIVEKFSGNLYILTCWPLNICFTASICRFPNCSSQFYNKKDMVICSQLVIQIHVLYFPLSDKLLYNFGHMSELCLFF